MTDNNNNNKLSKLIARLPECVQLSLILMFKVSAFILHRKHNIFNNGNGNVDMNPSEVSESWYGDWFYKDLNSMHLLFDVIIYCGLMVLFVIVLCKLIKLLTMH